MKKKGAAKQNERADSCENLVKRSALFPSLRLNGCDGNRIDDVFRLAAP